MPRNKNDCLAFEASDPANSGYQYLEDLSTAYWYSEVLFAALELGVFDIIDKGFIHIRDMAGESSCNEKELYRLLRVLERMHLVGRDHDGNWYNSQTVCLYLLPGQPKYIGDFILYRKYMRSSWQDISGRISINDKITEKHITSDDSYDKRNFYYVRAMDQLSRLKAPEIVQALRLESWNSPILDIGGGAGALARALLDARQGTQAVLFELPEIINAARVLYPEEEQWENLEIIEGDFINHEFPSERCFGLVVLSNFLHAYSGNDLDKLLDKATALLKNDGFLLIHDYFPDRHGISPSKGALYDLNMMLNTYEGECCDSSTVTGILETAGMGSIIVRDLDSDSSIIMSCRGKHSFMDADDLSVWEQIAGDEGFSRGVLVNTDRIVTGSWVQKKCRFGCPGYNKNLQCPPEAMTCDETRKMLDEYKWALILEGTPPSPDFHDKLLNMEKKAFFEGFHKAFAMGAGPCPVCSKCPEDRICRNPDKARPSMEASGIDVYATAENAGISLKPVKNKNDFVKYIGLLLLE